MGAKICNGQIITFLDAHCECARGWLEPLLAEIKDDRWVYFYFITCQQNGIFALFYYDCLYRTKVVCPIIDVISDETFQYIAASDLTWGGFNWRLNFRWYKVPQREINRRNGDRSLPIR